MKVSVIQFPGSNCDVDAYNAIKYVLSLSSEILWHKDKSLKNSDAVIIPGGFSFGDYLRCGAIARFSPIMSVVKEFSVKGGLILGICNGFQILCEAGLLPGCLIRNKNMQFHCAMENLQVEDSTKFFNKKNFGETLMVPIAHGEGNFRINEVELEKLEKNKQVLFRYKNNPNGAEADIAGIRNERGNIFGMMPHPERVFEDIHGGQDGIKILQAFIKSKQN